MIDEFIWFGIGFGIGYLVGTRRAKGIIIALKADVAGLMHRISKSGGKSPGE